MTSRFQSGWRRSIISWFSDKWQSNEPEVRKDSVGHRMEQIRISRCPTGNGRCRCQHRWRRWPRFGKEKRRTISASLVVIPPGSSTSTAKTFGFPENLRWKKGSLKHTCKCQTEANAKVFDLNGKTERALRTFALLYARFDQVISDVVIAVKDFDKEFCGDDHDDKRNVDWHRRQERERAGPFKRGRRFDDQGA